MAVTVHRPGREGLNRQGTLHLNIITRDASRRRGICSSPVSVSMQRLLGSQLVPVLQRLAFPMPEELYDQPFRVHSGFLFFIILP